MVQPGRFAGRQLSMGTGTESPLQQGFEMVRAIILEEELFAVENNLLTPTFKLKRPKLKVQISNCAHTCHLLLCAPLKMAMSCLSHLCLPCRRSTCRHLTIYIQA